MGCIRFHGIFLLSIFHLFICSRNTYGWDFPPQDSLIHMIENPSSSDKDRLEAYISLTKFARKTPQKALLFARSGQELAQEIENWDSYWQLELFKGRIYNQINDLPSAKNAYRRSIAYAKRVNDKILLARASNFFGILYGRISKTDSSIFYFKQTSAIWEELDDSERLVAVYNNLGLAYSDRQAFATALSYYIKAFSLPNRSKQDIREEKLLSNMGLMYFRLKDYERAEEYFLKSLDLAKKLGLQEEICLLRINLGSALFFQEKYQEAYDHLQKGTELGIKIGNTYPLAMGFRYIGKIYEAQQKYSTALSSFLQTAKFENQHQTANGETHTQIASMYYKLGKNDSALKYAHIGVDLADKKNKNEFAAQASELLSSIYEVEKDYKLALKYKGLYTEYVLDAQDERTEGVLLELQTEFETKLETKEREQELLLEKQKVSEKEDQITKEARYRKNLQILLVSLGILLAFSLAFGYRLQETYKKLKKLNQAIQLQHEQLNIQANELKIRNKDLEKFSMALGHDLKQPLTTIKGYADLLRKTVPKFNPRDLQKIGLYLRHLNEGVLRMENRIENLLKFYHTGAYMNQNQEVDLNHVLENVQSDLHQAIAQSHAHINYDQLPRVKGDPDLYAQVFQNLISNSIKYSKPHIPPEIEILPRKNGRFWKIAIQDNGIGIEKDYLPGIFDLFSRGNSLNGVQGQGIGLATCKRIIELHGGEIDVDSSPGLGTTFTLYIPLSRN